MYTAIRSASMKLMTSKESSKRVRSKKYPQAVANPAASNSLERFRIAESAKYNSPEASKQIAGVKPFGAMAKAEIGFWLKDRKGVLFLNDDDEWTDFITEKTGCDFIKFGRNGNLKYSFIENDSDGFGNYSIDFYAGKKKIPEIKLMIPGFHNIYNACCAASVAHFLGVQDADIKYGIEYTSAEEKRMNIFNKGGKIIINDCYNANPLSMKRAVDTLKLVSSKNNCRSVAILSDMLELGSDSQQLHYELGEYIFDSKIDVLITTGELSRNISRGFKSASLRNPDKAGLGDRVFHFKNKKDLAENMSKILKDRDTVLIKGSRANRLETLVDHV